MEPDEVREPRKPLKATSQQLATAIADILKYSSILPWNDSARLNSINETKFLSGLSLHNSSCLHVSRKNSIRCFNGDRLTSRDYIFRRCLGITKRRRLKSSFGHLSRQNPHRGSGSHTSCMNPFHLYFTVSTRLLQKEAACTIEREISIDPDSFNTFKARPLIPPKSKSEIIHEKTKMITSSTIDDRYIPIDVDMDERLLFGKIPIKEVCVYEESTLPDAMECDTEPVMIEHFEVKNIAGIQERDLPISKLKATSMKKFMPVPVSMKKMDLSDIIDEVSNVLLRSISLDSNDSNDTLDSAVHLPLQIPVPFDTDPDSQKLEIPIPADELAIECPTFEHELLKLEPSVYILPSGSTSETLKTQMSLEDHFSTRES